MVGTKRKQSKGTAREDWKYVNVLKKTFETGDKILKSEGKNMNIADVPELFRTLITMFILEWEEGRSFAEAKRKTFEKLSPTIKDINQVKFIVWAAMEEYFNEEIKRRGLSQG